MFFQPPSFQAPYRQPIEKLRNLTAKKIEGFAGMVYIKYPHIPQVIIDSLSETKEKRLASNGSNWRPADEYGHN
jgi:hypothetical protein